MPPKPADKMESVEGRLATIEASMGELQSSFKAAFLEMQRQQSKNNKPGNKSNKPCSRCC